MNPLDLRNELVDFFIKKQTDEKLLEGVFITPSQGIMKPDDIKLLTQQPNQISIALLGFEDFNLTARSLIKINMYVYFLAQNSSEERSTDTNLRRAWEFATALQKFGEGNPEIVDTVHLDRYGNLYTTTDNVRLNASLGGMSLDFVVTQAFFKLPTKILKKEATI